MIYGLLLRALARVVMTVFEVAAQFVLKSLNRQERLKQSDFDLLL
jgi:hypothetical protein